MQKTVSTIYRSAIRQNAVSLAVLDTSALVREAAARHGLTRGSRSALGRLLTATAYLCSWLEPMARLSVTLSGGGDCGAISAFGDGSLKLAGRVECNADGELNALVGKNGTLTISRDEGRLPFTGVCGLKTGDVAGDFEYYFEESEQRPTAISLYDGEREGEYFCGGVFLQPLTGASREELHWAKKAVCTDFSAMDVGEILSLFGADNAERQEITFGCTCSRERAERAIVAVGQEGALALVRAEGEIRLHCHDCNTDYSFGEKEIREIFARK